MVPAVAAGGGSLPVIQYQGQGLEIAEQLVVFQGVLIHFRTQEVFDEINKVLYKHGNVCKVMGYFRGYNGVIV